MSDWDIANKEWRYRYEERLGILCGTNEPTESQKAIARKEATFAVVEMWPGLTGDELKQIRSL